MGHKTSFFVVAFLLVFISMDAIIADDKGAKTPVGSTNKDASKDTPQTPVDPYKDASKDKPTPDVDPKKDDSTDKPKTPDVDPKKDDSKDKPKTPDVDPKKDDSEDKPKTPDVDPKKDDSEDKPKTPDVDPKKDDSKDKPKTPDVDPKKDDSKDKPKTPDVDPKKDDSEDKPKTPDVDPKKDDSKDKPKAPDVDPKKDDSKDKVKPPKPAKTDVEDYDVKAALPSGQEQAVCKQGHCKNQTLICPPECHVRKPKNNKKQKACFLNCGSKCEATCKWRKPKCTGYGALCYDPRFVGGDGVMFYFHGAKGGNFAIASDDNLHINAHFIGSRPEGRTRDYTWVQALSVMFDSHTLVLAAKKVSKWDDRVDALIVRWNGEDVTIPTDGEAEWRVMTEEREVVVERTDDTNTVKVSVAGLLELNVRVTPIGEEENRVHNYQIPSGDAFAHLETQFKFTSPSDLIEGILGKTYRPGYVSPVDRSVRMPMMGGEEKYQTPSLYSPLCNVCRFQRQSSEVPTIGSSAY